MVAINKMELLPWPLGGLEVVTRPALALCSRGGRIQYHPSVVTWFVSMSVVPLGVSRLLASGAKPRACLFPP